MEGMTFRMEGTKLIIEVDTTHEIGLSVSKKSILIASSGGIAATPVAGIKASISVFKNNPDRPE